MIEVVLPHALPSEWSLWEEARRQQFARHRASECYQLLYAGPGGGNGWVGDPIDLERAERIITAFSSAPDAKAIRAAGFSDAAGFCDGCNAFYCSAHWSTVTGYGRCPQGHGKGLDPHWHPDFDEREDEPG
jgi:hypothetical protein